MYDPNFPYAVHSDGCNGPRTEHTGCRRSADELASLRFRQGRNNVRVELERAPFTGAGTRHKNGDAGLPKRSTFVPADVNADVVALERAGVTIC